MSEDADYIVYDAGSGAQWAGQVVKVYQNVIGQPDKVYIGEFTVGDVNFGHDVNYVKLKQKLKAGTYDIYIHFESNATKTGDGGSSNLYYIGFITEKER